MMNDKLFALHDIHYNKLRPLHPVFYPYYYLQFLSEPFIIANMSS
jgi:hypothetical protein